MSLILGLAAFGNDTCFKSPTSAIRDINYLEMKNAIFDEVLIRERTDVLNASPSNYSNLDNEFSTGTLDGLETN